MTVIKAVYESSDVKGKAHVSCIKYRNLNNIAHYHSDYELVYVNFGNATVTVNEKKFNLSTNDCVFVGSNDIHYIQSDEFTVITVLKAGNKFFGSLFASKKLHSPIINTDLNIESFFNGISAELKENSDFSGTMSDSIATQLFIRLLRGEKTQNNDIASSKRIKASELYKEISGKIACEYSTITFEQAAKHVHFSEPYFSKIFHNVFGMTFTQYLNTVRVAVAIEKIKEGNLSITEISSECGFNTIRNFNRVFRNFTGYSPNNLPSDYVFLYNLREDRGLDPTLNCTESLE